MKSKLTFVVFLFLYINISFAKDVKVISSTTTALVVEYTPEYSDSSFVQIENQKYFRVSLREGELPDNIQPGTAVLPYRVLNIGVPSSTGNTIQIISSNFKHISGMLLPEPFHKRLDENNYTDVYEESPDYGKAVPADLVSFGEYGLIGNLPVQKINIYPVQFDASKNNINLLTRIVLKINFATPKGKTGKVKNELFKDAILNFNSAKNWGKPRRKGLLKTNGHSALATGTWYKFNVTKEGIYKIDRNKLADYGIDAATVDPRTIKIYNNGGYLLSPTVEKPRPHDLVENAIFVSGQEDGKFDSNDYILFYARGVNFWEYSPDSNKIARNRDYYSNKNYYWITSGGEAGKRMNTEASLNSPAAVKQTKTLAFVSHENDDENLMHSGIVLVGEKFSAANNSKSFMNVLSNRIANTSIKYVAQVVNYSPSSQRQTIPFVLEESGNTILRRSLRGSDGSYREGYLTKVNAEYDGTLTDNRSVLNFVFQSLKSDVFGYLDYFTIQYSALLKAVNDELIIFSDDSTRIAEYDLSNFSNSSIQIFNVTDYSNVKEISVPSNWISGGDVKFQVQEQAGKISKYLAITKGKYLVPEAGEKVNNSDIHGEQTGYQYIIITSRNFAEQAEKLATYRAEQAPIKYSSKVFYMDEITNEFSCGSLDPTSIRDFIKYAYDNWTVPPEFILLFGDGDWDYYNLLGYGTNFVPTFQTHESYHEIYSYPFDDYFARIEGNDKSVDIALGRIPVHNTDEADNMVNKIIEYETNSDRALWRNTITLVADDGPAGSGSNDGNRHTKQSEQLSANFIPKYFIQDKIYLAAYPTVITGQGRKKPAVNKAIVNKMNEGTLIVNFIGHGNPKVWTHEGVFQQQVEVKELTNTRYFFLSAATCDYGKFDDPVRESSPEEMMGMKGRGMIGGFLSTRPVFSSQNAALNDLFFSHLFSRDSKNKIIPIGSAYQLTKFTRTNKNDEKFNLICDPALRLDVPNLPGKIDSLNGDIPNNSLQVRALSNTSIKGSVTNSNGSLNSNFNGEAIITMFDSQRRISLPEMNYWMDVQGGVIFRGRASVENGLFKTNFTVPKDISYENKNGKIVAYFFNNNTDGIGFTKNFIVGGTDTTASNDGKGPKIDIFYDDFNFNNASLVNPNFTLLVKLNDKTGLNTTGGGVGHKLEGILNGDENNAIDFSNNFVGDLDAGGKSGVILYKFNNMKPGDYSIKIKAWDVFNNLSVEASNFTVVESGALTIKDVYNYPNPFTSNTAFTFQQNLNEPLNVKIKIYTVAGRLVRNIEENSILEKFVKIYWDGRDEDGGLLANGTYLYKLIVTSTDGNYSQSFLGKLAIIR